MPKSIKRGVAQLVDQDILGLDVAVSDPMPMSHRQHPGQLGNEGRGAARGDGLVTGVIFQVAPVHVFHHQIGPVPMEVEVVDPDQIGMLQVDKQPPLSEQAGAAVSTYRAAAQLEHQVVAQVDVHHPVDVGLAAAVEQTHDLVPADGVGPGVLALGSGPGRGDRLRTQPIIGTMGGGRIGRRPVRGRPGARRLAVMGRGGVAFSRERCRNVLVHSTQRCHFGLEAFERRPAGGACAEMLSDRGRDGLAHRERQQVSFVRTGQSRRHWSGPRRIHHRRHERAAKRGGR